MIIVQNPYNTMNVNWLNINTLFEVNKYYLSAREHKVWELLEVHDEILKKIYYLIHLWNGRCVYWWTWWKKMKWEFQQITLNHDSQDSQ